MVKSEISINIEKHDFMQIFDFMKISEILIFREKPIFKHISNL
jgi:hypothetical protein